MAPGISRSRLLPGTGVPNDHRPIEPRLPRHLSRLFHKCVRALQSCLGCASIVFITLITLSQVRQTTNHINPMIILPGMFTPDQEAKIREANSISKAIIDDMLELTQFLREQRPQGFALTFMYFVDYRASRIHIQDWLRPVHRIIYTPNYKLPFLFRLITKPSDNLSEWLKQAVSTGHT
ncbi:MAG: hypothetical protein OHK93_003832 [Ramalina farinacea]|uniref:Uncharacterized protein n=1 Tax=Ramalina farinacea TaxID=258253 RepID=A0AA43TRH5_9LECA|nr:hypothetical protein [Ramalina farinacea]